MRKMKRRDVGERVEYVADDVDPRDVQNCLELSEVAVGQQRSKDGGKGAEHRECVKNDGGDVIFEVEFRLQVEDKDSLQAEERKAIKELVADNEDNMLRIAELLIL